MPRPALALLAAAALAAACEAPAPRCTSPAAREIRTLDRLIAETRTNLDRGYAIGSRRGAGAGVEFCLGGGRRHVGVSFCSPAAGSARTGPVAIDLAAERRKLEGLEARRAALARQAAAEIAACEAQRVP